MANIVIKDLAESTELDSAAMATLTGGFSLGWTVARQPAGSFAPSVLNQFFTFNQFVADEIQIINQNQTVNLVDSAGAVVDLEENADNSLSRNTLPVF